MAVIKCPNCKRVLGTTNDSLTAELYCKGCKSKAQVRVEVAHSADYLPKEFNYKEENDKSK